MPNTVDLYDTTLRDGSQMLGISPSVDDKLKILSHLDRLGVSYVEGGWPGSNPKDAEFFERARSLELQTSTLTAFGMTRRPDGPADADPNLTALVDSGATVACIVGKASPYQVTDILRTTLEENLRMISESVSWLRGQGLRVFFDAEHFFDGFALDSSYALAALEAARDAGAEILVLCDTNGGTLPSRVEEVVSTITERLDVPIGGHFHNDAGCGVANSLAAVAAGVIQVQGCINGYGERCGNADLLTIAANLELKMGLRALPEGGLEQIAETSHFVAEVLNVPPDAHRPYVGHAAFAHKGGLHISAVVRDSQAYEHIDPTIVGNGRRLLASDLSGAATLMARARSLGIELTDQEAREALKRLKELEFDGYSFEAAEGSLELLLRTSHGWNQNYFEPLGFRAIVEEAAPGVPEAEATVRVRVAGERVVAAAEGRGPVDALNRALRRALAPWYPAVEQVRLTDYKVRVLDPESATAARVRVLVETSDEGGTWSTVGVSENIIEASWKALLDSLVVALIRRSIEPVPAYEARTG